MIDITLDVMQKAIRQIPFGSEEPFTTGDPARVEAFYARLIAGFKRTRQISVLRELDHHGSGYASYLSLFLFPSDGSPTTDHPAYTQTDGILLYLSRLAPIAVYGASSRTENKHNKGGSSGFITIENLDKLPGENWAPFVRAVETQLGYRNIELLRREPLSPRAPADLTIPTVFDGPYYVFDTLFYWCD